MVAIEKKKKVNVDILPQWRFCVVDKEKTNECFPFTSPPKLENRNY